jgi:hypothetical protein
VSRCAMSRSPPAVLCIVAALVLSLIHLLI